MPLFLTKDTKIFNRRFCAAPQEIGGLFVRAVPFGHRAILCFGMNSPISPSPQTDFCIARRRHATQIPCVFVGLFYQLIKNKTLAVFRQNQ
jgi:hypothetical protein